MGVEGYCICRLVHRASEMGFFSEMGRMEKECFFLLRQLWSQFCFLTFLLVFSRMVLGQEVSISLDSVRDDNLMQLKKLNAVLFPVRYNKKYHDDVLASGEFTKLAYYSDTCVGAIACKLDKEEDGADRVCIMTLGVLAPYRGLGIGTRLLNHVLDFCSRENTSEVYLHVQTDNEDAINFYKKFGFEMTETIHNYYRNTTSPDCYVLTKHMAANPIKR